MSLRRFVSSFCAFVLACMGTLTGCSNANNVSDANHDVIRDTYDITAPESKKYAITAKEDARVLIDFDGDTSGDVKSYGNWTVRAVTSNDTPFIVLYPYHYSECYEDDVLGATGITSDYSVNLYSRLTEVYGDTNYTETFEVFTDKLVELTGYDVETVKSFLSALLHGVANNDYDYDTLDQTVDLRMDEELENKFFSLDSPVPELVELFQMLNPTNKFNAQRHSYNWEDLASRDSNEYISKQSILRLLGDFSACDLKTAVDEYTELVVNARDTDAFENVLCDILMTMPNSHYPSYMFLELKAGTTVVIAVEYDGDDNHSEGEGTKLDFTFTSKPGTVDIEIGDVTFIDNDGGVASATGTPTTMPDTSAIASDVPDTTSSVEESSVSDTSNPIQSDDSDTSGVPVVEIGPSVEDIEAVPGVASFNIVDATEPVDPAQLWRYANSTFILNDVGIIAAENNKGEPVGLKLQGENKLISIFSDLLDTNKAFFIPEYTISDKYLLVGNVRLYDKDGQPLKGLNTKAAVQAWKDGMQANIEAELAEATLILDDSINVSELVPGVLYKGEGKDFKILNDTDKAHVLAVMTKDYASNWQTELELLPVTVFPDQQGYYNRRSSRVYFKLDTTSAEALIEDIVANDSKCMTISRMEAGEPCSIADFIYNDTAEDVTVYCEEGFDKTPVIIKAGELMPFDWTDYDVTLS